MEEDLELVGVAADGMHAVELAAELHPDAIVLDHVLPLLDGLHALPALTAVVPHATIVVFSASSDPATAATALSLGATRFLLKDRYGVADVIATLRECGLRHSLPA